MVGRGEDFPDTRANLAPLKTHAKERVSVKHSPGGVCTPLYDFTRVFAALVDDTARRFRVAEYINRVLGGMSEEDAFNTTLTANFASSNVIGALVEYDQSDADLFTVDFRAGARCEAPLELAVAGVGGTLSMISSKVSLHQAGVGSMSGGALSPCANTTIWSPLAALLEPFSDASGLLPHEPQYSLAWAPPGGRFTAVPPTISCPRTISLPSPGLLGAWDSSVAAHGAGEHTLRASFRGPAGGNATSITAHDALNVSRVTISGPGGVSTGPAGGELTVPPDYRGNVTFTAVNLLGLAASCTSLVTTFTTRAAWDPGTMPVVGEAAAPGPAATYYAGTVYSAGGPLVGVVGARVRLKSTLFQGYTGDASRISFRVAVTPPTDNLFYVDSRTGSFVVVPRGRHTARTNYTAVMYGEDEEGAEAVVKTWEFVVAERPRLRVVGYERYANPKGSPDAILDGKVRAATGPLALGEPFQFAPINLTDVRNTDGSGVNFTIGGNATQGGFFINPTTGEVSPSRVGGKLVHRQTICRTPPYSSVLPRGRHGECKKGCVLTHMCLACMLLCRRTGLPLNGPGARPGQHGTGLRAGAAGQ